MSEQKAEEALEYVGLLQESRSLDDTLAATASMLSDLGKRLVGVGNSFQNSETILSVDAPYFEEQVAQIPSLLQTYKEKYNRRVEIESRLTKFSFHRGRN